MCRLKKKLHHHFGINIHIDEMDAALVNQIVEAIRFIGTPKGMAYTVSFGGGVLILAALWLVVYHLL